DPRESETATEPPAVDGGPEMAEWPAPDTPCSSYSRERSRKQRGCPTSYRRFRLLALCGLLLCCWRLHRLHDSDRAVRRREGRVGYPANIFLGNFLQAIDVVEELAPIAVPGLVDCQLLGQPAIVAKAAN